MDNKYIQSTISAMSTKSLELINQDVENATNIKKQINSLLESIKQMEDGKIQWDQQVIQNYYYLAGSFYASINNMREHLPSPELLQK